MRISMRGDASRFLNECFQMKVSARTPAANIKMLSAQWAEMNGVFPAKPKDITRALRARGCISRKTRGVIVWLGLHPRVPVPPPKTHRGKGGLTQRRQEQIARTLLAMLKTIDALHTELARRFPVTGREADRALRAYERLQSLRSALDDVWRRTVSRETSPYYPAK